MDDVKRNERVAFTVSNCADQYYYNGTCPFNSPDIHLTVFKQAVQFFVMKDSWSRTRIRQRVTAPREAHGVLCHKLTELGQMPCRLGISSNATAQACCFQLP
jgi:hypothetical protein